MFKKIDNKYRPLPFWSWNEKLDVNETKKQVQMMADAGMGGFFMHARGGLQTEYMGSEWFDNISASIDEAKKTGMQPWAYDENGWPSGFGNGKVCGIGEIYQQKYLRYDENCEETPHTICISEGLHFYYEINPFYIDVLCRDAISTFIKEVYEPYYNKYKNSIEGFFTDEPQVSRNGIPWSLDLPDAYKEAYGEEIYPHLIELFKPVGDFENTRLKFWKLVTEMFSESYFKQIYTWCDKRGLKFTGHVAEEGSMLIQTTANGAVMPHYEYFHIPGMDWLGRPIYKCLTPYQLASAAHQMGKKQILTETFALCGHNVGHDELKGILEWQMSKGATLYCQHLEGYSLRGIRKRDYPPAMYYQQPWWADYRMFNDAMSRVGMILTEGKVEYDTLLIHPISSAWVCYDNGENKGLEEINQGLLDAIDALNEKHILFHLGDEILMERHAKVEGDTLVLGTQRYKTVVLPPYKILFDNTKRLLDEFRKNGGKITTVEALPENNIVSSPYITYTKRKFDSFDVYYFVNSTANTYDTEISVGNQVMDIKTGETSDFYGSYTFKAFDSLVLIDDGKARKPKPCECQLKALDLSGEWDITNSTLNSITLDKCDYYFDGELVEKNGYVLDIQGKACDLKRPVKILCKYNLKANYIPAEAYLVCETPEIFDIYVNGKYLEKQDCGYFRDKSFRKLDISKHLVHGDNSIELSVDFKQSREVYEQLEKAVVFESELNKLTYDMEIEPIYVIGNFSVRCDGEFKALDKNAVRYIGDFVIDQPMDKISLTGIEKQGYPFFSGEITVEKIFNLDTTDYKLAFSKKGINAVRIKINGEEVDTLMWEPLASDISKYLKKGENKVELTLVNNLRNLLGPHHLEEGECHFVCASSFFKGNSMWLWKGAPAPEWNEDYCFVETSIY